MSQDFIEAATEIARDVYKQASYARDGGIYWRPPAPASRQGRSALPKQLDSYLYPGSTGIALFFALAAKVLGLGRYGQLALEVIAPLRRELREIAMAPPGALAGQRRIGGLAGLGSLVYGMVRLGDLLGRPELWDEATELAALITPERISCDLDLDVMTGSAGAILALLALHARRPEANRAGSRPLDQALRIAEHLLLHRTPSLPIGFCHGTAGIACALARLARKTGRSDLGNAAREEWARVEAAYDSQVENWRLPHSGEVAGNSWCNGATGILLGGLTGLSSDLTPSGESLRGALKTLLTSPLDAKDHLCCGNMGRIDALVYAAEMSQDPRILKVARSLALQVLNRAGSEGRYRLMFYPEDLIDIRLFPGLTGIGYAFLRLATPESIPCLLVMA